MKSRKTLSGFGSGLAGWEISSLASMASKAATRSIFGKTRWAPGRTPPCQMLHHQPGVSVRIVSLAAIG